jgi:hypothetical protein
MSAQQAKNGQSSSSPTIPKLHDDDWVDTVVDTGIDADVAESVHDMLTNDMALAKIRNADREYARLKAENLVKFVECDHPPEDSMLQGALRAGLLADLSDRKSALSEEEKTRFKSILLVSFFRTSRSIDGWQQDKLTENIQTRRMEDNRESDDSDGIFGVFG